jgi:hypothetical protein
MNCRDWEERIAGDLDDAAAEAHIAECPGCQVFASGLRQTLAELRSAHAEEIAPAHYAAVRARVMAELRPRRRWGWIWAAAGVAAAVFIAVSVESRMKVQELPVVAVRVAVPPSPLPDGRGSGGGLSAESGRGSLSAVSENGARRERVKAPRRRAPREEIVMKIETGDPDVVIYWIAEAKGDY